MEQNRPGLLDILLSDPTILTGLTSQDEGRHEEIKEHLSQVPPEIAQDIAISIIDRLSSANYFTDADQITGTSRLFRLLPLEELPDTRLSKISRHFKKTYDGLTVDMNLSAYDEIEVLRVFLIATNNSREQIILHANEEHTVAPETNSLELDNNVRPLIQEGLSNREIAEKLGNSFDAVRNSVRRLLRKGEVERRTQRR